jgi:hypothetical protein
MQTGALTKPIQDRAAFRINGSTINLLVPDTSYCAGYRTATNEICSNVG